ncbi:beta strand repeat-containing protein, partial [Methylobacterium sp. JK268]
MTLYYFNGAAGYDWTDNVLDQNSGAIVQTSWTSNYSPTTGDDVEIGPGSPTSTVLLTRGTYNHTNLAVSVHSVTIDSGITLQQQGSGGLTVGGTFTNNGVYNRTNSSGPLNLANTIVNNGLMTVEGVYDYRAINIGPGTVSLTGMGNLRLRGAVVVGPDNNAISYLENSSTISGSGNIGQVANYQNMGGYVIVHNHGTINADVSGATLVLQPRSTPTVNPTTNDGLMEATGGGTLVLQQTNLDQTGSGTVAAYGAGSTVTLVSGRLRGGSVDGSGGGIVQFGAAGGGDALTADGRSSASGGLGAITIKAGGTLSTGSREVNALGTLNNQGTILVNNNLLVGAGDLTLTGGGKVTLSGNIGGYSSAATVTLHNVDNTISGFGQVGIFRETPSSSDQFMNIDNQARGAIIADTANATLAVAGTTVTNAGLLEAKGSGTLAIRGATIQQTGSGANAGSIIVDGTTASVDLGYGAVIQGGVVAGVNGGIVTASDVTFDGSSSYGAVTIYGTVNTSRLVLKNAINNNGGTIFNTRSGGLLIDVSGATLSGNGTVRLSSTNDGAAITGGTGAILHNVGNTIAGGGTIGVALDNQAGGKVLADDGATPLTVAGVAVTNAGSISATGSGLLAFNGSTITQSGSGIIKADGASASLKLQYGATIVGGTLAALNGATGTIGQYGATLDGSTSAGGIALQGAFTSVGTKLLGAVANTGTLTVRANTTLAIGAGNVTLSGGGPILLDYDATNQVGGNIIGEGGAVLHNVGNTLAGAGSISAVLDNTAGGTVNANVSGAKLLVNGGSTDTNAGLIEATSGGTLTVSNTTIDQRSGGRLFVGDGSVVHLDGANVLAGSLQGAGSGYFDLTGGSLSVTATTAIAATVKIGGGFTLYASGDVANRGAILVTGGVLKESGSWTGGGQVTLSSTGAISVSGPTTNVDNVIAGTGSITSNDAGTSFTNGGVIDANVSGSELMLGTNLALVNNGLLEAENGGVLTVASAVTGSGSALVKNGGTLAIGAGFAESIAVSGANTVETVKLGAAYAGTISGLGLGDRIDLTNLTYSGQLSVSYAGSFTSGTLAVRDGSGATLASLKLAGAYTQSDFTLADDGSGQTLLRLSALNPVPPQPSPVFLPDLGLAQGWGSLNNPRRLVDVDGNRRADYLAFGAEYTFLANGGTFANGQGQTGPGFVGPAGIIHDFGTNEGYTAQAQRGAAMTGAGVAASVYGQGYAGVYWYAAQSQTTQTDAAGHTYATPTYDSAPHFYANFGTQQGWTPHNGFQVLKTSRADTYASILGFGNDGIVVGGQAFAPGASAAQVTVLPASIGNNGGWDQLTDVRTFLDSDGGIVDLNHDGVADFIGMGPQGTVFAYGQEDP